jgi:hypothetical protein
MRNLRASYWCGRRTLGASPANVWGRWWFRSSDVETDENRRKVGEPGPSLERAVLPAGKVALCEKRAAFCEKEAWDSGFRGLGSSGPCGGTRSPGAWFAAASAQAPTSFVLKWQADRQGW